MPAETYLEQLTTRLTRGLAGVPEDTRSLHAGYLRAAQNADGGFSGREGGSDLYYTGFALRGLAVLDTLTPEICERAASFLRQAIKQEAGVVDFFSFLYSCLLVQVGGGPDVLAGSAADWPERVARTLESFRTKDGGYAKTLGGVSGSTYHTFLVGLCYQLLGRAYPGPDDVMRFLRSRRRDDGGFVEIGPMKRSGTNPTAAAVGVADILVHDRLIPAGFSEEEREGIADFLGEMASLEGGLRANGRAPLADLLSTFTGSWTLAQLGRLDRLNADDVSEFAASLALPAGGFRGGLWDEHADVEYTFYGLGVMGLFPET